MRAITHDATVSSEVISLINKHRYREKFGLSVKEFEQEPIEDINLAMLIWKAEDKRQQLEQKRAEQKSRLKHGK